MGLHITYLFMHLWYTYLPLLDVYVHLWYCLFFKGPQMGSVHFEDFFDLHGCIFQ